MNCRFGSQEKDSKGGSLVYQDLEDVFVIAKDYAPDQVKNQNKLPEELIKKLILYSSNPGDMVCDFFMGNFTTAYMALGLKRNVCGYELNQQAYDYHMPIITTDLEYGGILQYSRKFDNIVPKNQGKRISSEEAEEICREFARIRYLEGKKSKREIIDILQEKFQRGPFSIQNILDKQMKDFVHKIHKV
jgi:site-specific DNA-methyltransferase (adenine-specific)